MKKILMTLALLCTLAQGAWAETVTYTYYTVNADGKTVTKHEDGSADATELTSSLISGNTEDRIYGGWYVLKESFTYSERIVIYGDVKLILKDGCTLTAQQGIRINTGATLTIYGQTEGTGKIIATETHHDKAAIGGNKNYEAGILRIHGGEIEADASSGKYAAGIGGGYGDGSGMKEITIYGGKVTANGANYGAGIGGGKNNENSGTITIYGGTVTATAGKKSAGIGGGENCDGWTTVISGGNVTATGGEEGAGIGGGVNGNGGTITINGGTVTATGYTTGCGIGGGKNGNGGIITINGGDKITATGGISGAGIGGKGSGRITINGGSVVARSIIDKYISDIGSLNCGAGIGSVEESDVEEITITGGNVEAYGHAGAAGIGGSSKRSCGTITISGGEIKAYGGTVELEDAENPGSLTAIFRSGAAIGGGSKCKGGSVTITGTANIEAHGGLGAAAIGAGNKGKNVLINISGGAVNAYIYHTTEGGDSHAVYGDVIGAGYEGNTGSCTLTLPDDFCVEARENFEGEYEWAPYSLVYGSRRTLACQGSAYHNIKIYQHTDHRDFIYTITDDKTAHIARCNYCLYTYPAETHDNIDECSKCHYLGTSTVATVTIATPDGGSYLAKGYNTIKGQNFVLPTCDAQVTGMEFVGWLIGGSIPTTLEAAPAENLKEAGYELEVSDNISVYARYRNVYTEAWQWGPNNGWAQVYIQKSGEQPIGPIQATVTSDYQEPTTTLAGGTNYTATATYTTALGNKYTFTDVQEIAEYIAVSLNENDNSATLADNNNVTATVTLTGRTLYKDGSWNTLCLPFSVADISTSPLAGAIVKELTDASFSESTLTLTFADATTIEAGQAYLIKWDKPTGYDDDPSAYDLSEPLFTGVTLANYLCNDAISTDDSGDKTVTFFGTYKKIDYTADNRAVLFLGANNTLYYPQSGATIGAQRGYFQLSGLTAGDVADPESPIRAFTLDFGDGDNTTGIITVSTDSKDSSDFKPDGWYSLDGRRLNDKPTARGIYINNGKKVVIK